MGRLTIDSEEEEPLSFGCQLSNVPCPMSYVLVKLPTDLTTKCRNDLPTANASCLSFLFSWKPLSDLPTPRRWRWGSVTFFDRRGCPSL